MNSAGQLLRRDLARERSHYAKTIDELGFKLPKKGKIEMMFGPRDYSLAAVAHLVKAKVVQITEDRKFYLSEENLAASKWKG